MSLTLCARFSRTNASPVDDALASYYGATVPPDAPEIDGFRKAEPGQCAGLITRGSFLAMHARPNDASPIHRGVVIHERFLCQELPPHSAARGPQPKERT